jgi:hypothetical protein
MASWIYNISLHSALDDCSPAKALMGFQPKGLYNLPYGDPSEKAIQGKTRAKDIQ